MTVGEYCTREVTVVDADEGLRAVATLMRANHVGDVVVVRREGTRNVPIGIITDRDIVIGLVAPGVDFEALCARDVIGAQLHTVPETMDLFELLGRMRAHAVRRMPVVDATGALVGIVTLDDVLGALADALHAAAAVAEKQLRREAVRRP